MLEKLVDCQHSSTLAAMFFNKFPAETLAVPFVKHHIHTHTIEIIVHIPIYRNKSFFMPTHLNRLVSLFHGGGRVGVGSDTTRMTCVGGTMRCWFTAARRY